jgi:diguanylate cyclase (GGDEF)-like protein
VIAGLLVSKEINDRNAAAPAAKKILGAICALKIDNEKNPPGIVTVSVGVRIVDADDNDDVETVYQKADQALYQAKQSGRNRFVVSNT